MKGYQANWKHLFKIKVFLLRIETRTARFSALWRREKIMDAASLSYWPGFSLRSCTHTQTPKQRIYIYKMINHHVFFLGWWGCPHREKKSLRRLSLCYDVRRSSSFRYIQIARKIGPLTSGWKTDADPNACQSYPETVLLLSPVAGCKCGAAVRDWDASRSVRWEPDCITFQLFFI